jgi:hypothetical protein
MFDEKVLRATHSEGLIEDLEQHYIEEKGFKLIFGFGASAFISRWNAPC